MVLGSKAKLLIRNLPPEYGSDEINNLLSSHIKPEWHVKLLYWTPGKQSSKRAQTSTVAYIECSTYFVKQILEAFSNVSIEDSKSVKKSLVIQYAMNQRVPKNRSFKDTKCGAYRNDPVYLRYQTMISGNEQKETKKSVGRTTGNKVPGESSVGNNTTGTTKVEGSATEAPIRAALVQYLLRNDKESTTNEKTTRERRASSTRSQSRNREEKSESGSGKVSKGSSNNNGSSHNHRRRRNRQSHKGQSS